MAAEPSNSASRPDIVRALRAAAFTGLVAFGLFLPLIAFRAVHDIRNELVLETRWPLFAAFVAGAFVSRLIWELMPRERLKQQLAVFFRSPVKLAAAAGACALAATVLRIVAKTGFGTESAVALLLSYLFAFGTIAFAVGAAVAGTLARNPASTEHGRQRRRQIGAGLKMAALGFLIAYPLMVFWLLGSQGSIKWIDNYGIQILIYVMLGWGLNIVVGLAGLLDLGYVAFYAVGAYSFALLAKNGLPFIAFTAEYPFLAVDFYQLGPWAFWVLLPIAGLLASFWGMLLGFPVLRLRGDYLAIVTLAFGEIIRLVLINWVDLTNGYAGIADVPRPTFFGIPFIDGPNGFAARFGIEFSAIHRTIFLYYVILVLALITAFITIRLRRLPIGRAWEALARGRNCLPRTRHQHHHHQAHGVRHRGDVRRLCRIVLRRTARLRLAGELHLHGIGDDRRDRRAWRHGQPDRRRPRGDHHDRRHRSDARARCAQGYLRQGLRPDPIPHAAVRPRHGPDHDLEAARPDLDAGAVRVPQGAQGGLGRACAGGPRMSDELLRVEHLTMRFGGLVAINDLCFSAERGHITALIGPNGAGKTTVFNCITGFYKPTEGRIALQYGDPAVWSELDTLTQQGHRSRHRHGGSLFLLERMPDHLVAKEARVARTFQNIRLFPGMTVLENLLVAQHVPLMRASGWTVLGLIGFPSYGRAERAAIEKARVWLDRIGLTDRADDPAGALPYGAQRELEIARAMCTDPVLLCLDEPAAGLNPSESAELARFLRSLCNQHATSILLIEHDMSVVMEISDHVIVLDHGVKIADGPPDAVRNDQKVIAAYLGVEDDEVSKVEAEVGL